MSPRPSRWLLVAVLACALLGCGRRVVMDPKDVATQNDRTWTVTSVPRDAGAVPENASHPESR
jgi:hypothetical protein